MKSLCQILLLIAVAIVAAVIAAAIIKPYRVANAEVAAEYEYQLGRQLENLRELAKYEATK